MSRYAAMFRRSGNAGVFGAFVMLGDPDLARCAAILDRLVEAEADMIEVGIPFSDPIADGPVIQAAAARALANGTTPAACFALLAAFRRRHPEVPVGILTYANLVLARGRDDFYRRAARAGVDSVLVADVPVMEVDPFVEAARAHGVAPVLIAAANTPEHRLREIAGRGDGYTYCVARAGVTGTDQEARFEHCAMLDILRDAGAPPPVFGFGISHPGHVRAALAAGAAGVICGSAIVERVARGEDVAGFVRAMRAAAL